MPTYLDRALAALSTWLWCEESLLDALWEGLPDNIALWHREMAWWAMEAAECYTVHAHEQCGVLEAGRS